MPRTTFEDLVFEAFKDQDSYDRLKHQILRVKEIMIRAHPSFKRMRLSMQFDYCCTIAAIAASTATHNLNKLSTFSRRKEDSEFKYSIEAGFKEVKNIPIANNNFKRLTK